MARLPRFALPGHPQHVITRGNNRGIIFADDQDYYFFRDCLAKACIEHEVVIHAYVFMTNHVHFLMTPQTETGISKVMQSVGRRYVQYFNSTYRRSGTLWEGRYKAALVETERYLLTCYRYIELNPVRANMVKQPSDYRWSSYRCNAHGHNDKLVTPHPLYMGLAATDPDRYEAYRYLFRTHMDEDTLQEIRDATNKAWALGSERFHAEMEMLLNRQTRPIPRGGDRRSENWVD